MLPLLLALAILPDTGAHWRAPETALAVVATVALGLDAWQTSQLARQGFTESNPVLGSHPTMASTAVYFAAAIGATWTLPRLIHSQTLRRVALGAVIGIEAACVVHGRQLGVKLTF